MKTGELAIIAILAGVAGLAWTSSQIRPPKITAPPISKPPTEPDGDDSGVSQWIKLGEDLLKSIFGGGSSTPGSAYTCADGSVVGYDSECASRGGLAPQSCQGLTDKSFWSCMEKQQ